MGRESCLALLLAAFGLAVAAPWASTVRAQGSATELDLQMDFKRAAAALAIAEQEANRLKDELNREKSRAVPSDVERQVNRETISRLEQDLAGAEQGLREKQEQFRAAKARNDQAIAVAARKAEEQRKQAEANRWQGQDGAPGKPGWAVDQQTGCRLWNTNPQPDETVRWSGGCADGLATGRGTYEWFLGGKPGSRYDGEMKAGYKDGEGSLELPNGSKYQGHFTHGLFNGRGVYVLSSGNRLEGTFQEGSKLFRGTYSYKDGTRFEGELKDNIKIGKGTMWYTNGARYVGDFVELKRSGRGMYFYSNGAKYEGDWQDNEKSGEGVMNFADGTVYRGHFKSNLRSGFGRFQTPRGTSYVGNWENDKPSGQGKYVGDKGEVFEGRWTNGCFKEGTRWAYVNSTKEACGF